MLNAEWRMLSVRFAIGRTQYTAQHLYMHRHTYTISPSTHRLIFRQWPLCIFKFVISKRGRMLAVVILETLYRM